MIPWKEFLCSLTVEDDAKFTIGEKLMLTVRVSPRGETEEDGTHLYEHPQKLFVLINEIKSKETVYNERLRIYINEVVFSCSTMKPLPSGFKHGTYTLYFSDPTGTFICCENEGVSQMALDEIIPPDQWEQMQQERQVQYKARQRAAVN